MTREDRDKLLRDISLSDSVGQLRHTLGMVVNALPVADPAPVAADILKSPVSSLGLSVRARRAMELLGIETLADLCSHTGDELMIKNFGVSSRQEVVEKLAERGFRLRHPHEKPGTIPPPLVTDTTWAGKTELEAAVGALIDFTERVVFLHRGHDQTLEAVGNKRIARVRAAMGRKDKP